MRVIVYGEAVRVGGHLLAVDLGETDRAAVTARLADPRPQSRGRLEVVLGDFLAERRPDVLHCHLPNDHLIGGKAVRRAGPPLIPIVRSLYDGEPPALTRRTRLTLGGMTQRLVCLSQGVADFMREQAPDYGFDATIVRHLPPPIDTDARRIPAEPSKPGPFDDGDEEAVPLDAAAPSELPDG